MGSLRPDRALQSRGRIRVLVYTRSFEIWNFAIRKFWWKRRQGLGRERGGRNTLTKGEHGAKTKGEKGWQCNHAKVQSFQNTAPRYFIHAGLGHGAQLHWIINFSIPLSIPAASLLPPPLCRALQKLLLINNEMRRAISDNPIITFPFARKIVSLTARARLMPVLFHPLWQPRRIFLDLLFSNFENNNAGKQVCFALKKENTHVYVPYNRKFMLRKYTLRAMQRHARFTLNLIFNVT